MSNASLIGQQLSKEIFYAQNGVHLYPDANGENTGRRTGSFLSDYEFLMFGFRINECNDEDEHQLINDLLAIPYGDPETEVLLQALSSKIGGPRSRRSLETTDRLMDLARSWTCLEDSYLNYQMLFLANNGIDDMDTRVVCLCPEIQGFHRNLSYFSGSSEPRQLAKALIRIQEMCIYLDKYKFESEWPFYSAAYTIWRNLD